MMYAKAFGMIWDRCNDTPYFGDMMPDRFKKMEHKNLPSYATSLDHLQPRRVVKQREVLFKIVYSKKGNCGKI